MITGAHFVMYSKEAEADRTFFQDVLGFRSVDAGGGWLIFALPPAELGVHPFEAGTGKRTPPAGREMAKVDLYLMCDDLHKFITSLRGRNVKCAAIEEAPWGLRTTIPLPSGNAIGLYQPRHPTAIGGARKKKARVNRPRQAKDSSATRPRAR